ncbi:3'-5' exonuclease [Pseudoalteromonas sp. SSDWG2]|uniref:3'-5' exonuclease n=1 Tax=Pseudoalteromonas sp. SSDWG2 TaxID=3139391 RepID=UPI003BA8F3F4
MKRQANIQWDVRYHALCQSSVHPSLKAFYKAGLCNGQTTVANAQFVALDFETTGLNSDTDDIVSIGLVPFDWQRIYCHQSRHWVVQPKSKLNQESVVIHGITHSDVEAAPDLMSVLTPLLEAIQGRVVVVHYHPIERTFLANALLKRIGEGIEFATIDTMEIERLALNSRRGVIGKLLREKIPSLRLADCRERYNLPLYSAHNAFTDALATAELLQAQLRYHYRSDTPIGDIWI